MLTCERVGMNNFDSVSGLLVHIICLSSLDLVQVLTVRHNFVPLFFLYVSASVEHDDHYVKIAGQVTSDLNSRLQLGGGGV